MTTPYGKRVETIRALRGWNQSQLATRAGYTQRTISILESAVNKEQVSSILHQSIEAAFNLSLYSDQTNAAFAILSANDASAGAVLSALTRLEGGNNGQ